MLVFKSVYRLKKHKKPESRPYMRGKVTVNFSGWFLLGIIPLILWQTSFEDQV